jgi:Type II secretion system (T2SS), protein G
MMRHVLLGLSALGLLGAGYGYLGYGAKPVDPVFMAKMDMKSLERAVTDYCIKKGEYPPNLDTLVSEGAVNADGLRDPWKHEYQYDPNGRKNKGARPDIWTVTPSREIIGNWGKDAK